MSTHLPDYAVYNGKVVPFDQARVHVMSPVVHYATGVFEGIRGYWNQQHQQMYIFKLNEHLNRLEDSQKILGFETIVDRQYIHENILKIISANQHKETIHIRPCVFIEGHGTVTATGPVGHAITTIARPSPLITKTGCTAQVSSWIRTSENSTPTRVKAFSNYMNSRMAEMQAVHDGYDTAILLRNDGSVAEGPRMCLFMIKDGVLITPDLGSDILESITRQTLFEICNDYDIKCVERKITRSELYTADEVFFCGSGWEITPVNQIDHVLIGNGKPGRITQNLQTIYQDIVCGQNTQYSHWLTPVY